MTFLKQVWYACAWADELQPNQPLSRLVADTPLVLFRQPKGTPSALEDRCPHRFAPLSRGQLTSRGIRCGYHGLEFGGTGQCVANPHGPVLESLRVRSYPTVEKYKLIWIWLGDPASASIEEIPDLSFVETAPENAISKGYLPTVAHHLLM